jgi:glutaredoxin
MNVVIYSKDKCSYCTKAKMLMTSKGIHYTELKLGEDFTRETLLEQFPEAKSFPIIVIDGFNIGGYDALSRRLNEETQQSQKFLSEEE